MNVASTSHVSWRTAGFDMSLEDMGRTFDRALRHSPGPVVFLSCVGALVYLFVVHPELAHDLMNEKTLPLMGMILVFGMAILYLMRQVEKNRLAHELCQREQSAMYTAIINLAMSQTGPIHVAQQIINELDAAIQDAKDGARISFTPKRGPPMPGGRRERDP